MTTEERRITIAEHCGWKFIPIETTPTIGFYYYNPSADEILLAKQGKLQGATAAYELPKYDEDLNAMHAAWLTLNERQQGEFYYQLSRVIQGPVTPNKEWLKCAYGTTKMSINATAAQREEAFLLTIGKT